jgi:hypothetical protein
MAALPAGGRDVAGGDVKLRPFGPIVLDPLKGAAESAGTSDYR